MMSSEGGTCFGTAFLCDRRVRWPICGTETSAQPTIHRLQISTFVVARSLESACASAQWAEGLVMMSSEGGACFGTAFLCDRRVRWPICGTETSAQPTIHRLQLSTFVVARSLESACASAQWAEGLVMMSSEGGACFGAFFFRVR